MKYNILVTGANGQLGSEIKVISNDYAEYQFFFTDFEELDITKKNEINKFVKTYKINIIINCAAYTAVDKAEDEKEKANLINVTGPDNLSEISSQNNIVLIHISTDYVFDGTNCTPYKEDDKTKPIGFYGLSKYNGEQSVLKHNSKTIIIRTSWLYSLFGNNFVKTIQRLASTKNSIDVIFDQIGTPTYANDLAKAILSIIQNMDFEYKHKDIYHFSNEGVTSWYDFACAIVELTNSNCKVNPIESSEFYSKTKRPFYSVLNKKKIKNKFNIVIPHWRDALKRAFQAI